MPLQRVPINNFRGGLNTRDSPFELQPNESPDLLNVTLTPLVGQLTVRGGKTRFDTNSPGPTIDHCRQVVLNGTHWLMCSVDGSIYSCDQAGNFVLRHSGTAGRWWDFAQMPDINGNDQVWCCNGTDSPQKWDGIAATTSAWAGAPSANWSRILVWKNKLVAITTVYGANYLIQATVYFSKTGDPEATTGTYDTLQLRGDDDELGTNTDINVLADRLYVFKKRSVWVVNDPVTLSDRRVGEPGCWNRFQSDVLEEKLYFFNEQGIWSTGGVAIALESGSITSWFPQHLTLSAIDKVRMISTRDSYPRLLLSVPVDGSAANNQMIELVPHINFRRIGGRRYLLLPAFMVHTLDAASLAAYKPSATGQWGIYGGSSSLGRLYHYLSGTTDDGAAITAHWTSAWMAIQGEEPFERVRRLNVEFSGDLTVSVFKDFNTVADFTATFTADTLWQGGTWQGGQWNTANQYRFQRVRPESRGRFHQIRFDSVNPGSAFFINVAELAIRGGKEH